MADKTTGELRSVNIGDLPGSADIYDDFKMPGELQGEAVHVTGAQFKQYAVQAVKPIAEGIDEKVVVATNAGAAAQSALAGVREALSNLPEGSTLIVNDLTTGGTSAALSAEMGKVLGRRPNPNLLHNWDFTNPVNQRGQTVYSGAAYSIDRWKNRNANMETEVTDTGLIIRNTSADTAAFISQAFEAKLPPGEYTFSVMVTDVSGDVFIALYNSAGGYGKRVQVSAPGVIAVTRTITATENYRTARIVLMGGASVSVVAAKVERGGEQTLAHQDASGQWVLNEIPDYGEELAKCQRYQVDIGGYYPVAVNSGGMSYTFLVQLPFDMRSTPNVDLSNAVITTPNVQADTSGKLSLSDFIGRTMKIRFVPTVAPVTLGDAVLNIPAATIADANL